MVPVVIPFAYQAVIKKTQRGVFVDNCTEVAVRFVEFKRVVFVEQGGLWRIAVYGTGVTDPLANVVRVRWHCLQANMGVQSWVLLLYVICKLFHFFNPVPVECYG